MPGGQRRWRPVIGLVAVLAVVLTIVVSPTGARQQPIPSTQGHAQIIAQGVVPMPAGEAAWRVVYRTIEPGGPTSLPPGYHFVLVDQGTLLVESVADTRSLGQGEAMFLTPGSVADGTAVDERPAGYYALDLVEPELASDPGDGLPIFAGEAFPAPTGERDLKLIRDVLAPDETTTITSPDDEAPMVILATLGTIAVESSDAAGDIELRVGEAATVTGEVTVRGSGLAPATFVAAVIGREVTERSAVVAASPAASPAASAGGTVAVRLHACPAGMRPGESNTNLCPPDFDAVELTLVAVLDDGVERDLGEPEAAGSVLQWTGLAPGDYLLQATGFGPGFDHFFVPGLTGAADDGAQGYPAGLEGGYRLPITSDSRFNLDVFAFTAGDQPPRGTPVVRTTAVAVRQDETGAVGVRMHACPTVGLFSFDPAACALASPPFDVSLVSPDLPATLTLADTEPGADGYQTWDDLEPGDYVLQVPLMPAGTIAYFTTETATVTLLPDGTGYAVAVGDDAEPVLIDVYAVGPEPAPPTAVPTVAPEGSDVTPDADAVDSDGDGLTDAEETNVHGTDPTLWDTDGDGVGDGDEIAAGTDPFTPDQASGGDGAVDTDMDGLPDAEEAGVGTDPFNADTDGDGWLDGNEILLGSDPLNSNSFPASP